jgi:hypothetical protein
MSGPEAMQVWRLEQLLRANGGDLPNTPEVAERLAGLTAAQRGRLNLSLGRPIPLQVVRVTRELSVDERYGYRSWKVGD